MKIFFNIHTYLHTCEKTVSRGGQKGCAFKILIDIDNLPFKKFIPIYTPANNIRKSLFTLHLLQCSVFPNF